MTETIRKYLELNRITGYKIAKENKVAQPTIDRAANKPLDNLSFKNLRAIAKSLNKTPGQVADELDNMEKDEIKMTKGK